MKGYIYTMYKGADPGIGWHMTDPIFGARPTLGACMPNIRRLVLPGDAIFVVSGMAAGVEQYVVGGFAVDEKINALSAYKRFPENRQRQIHGGALSGNVIVGPDGTQNSIDYHTNFERRLENYVIGRDPITLESEREVELGRDRSLEILKDIFGRPQAKTLKDVLGRWRKLDEHQINDLRSALDAIKREANRNGR